MCKRFWKTCCRVGVTLNEECPQPLHLFAQETVIFDKHPVPGGDDAGIFNRKMKSPFQFHCVHALPPYVPIQHIEKG
nr:MAG TPA: hypothetical protein [Caudoviricetes sp.]